MDRLAAGWGILLLLLLSFLYYGAYFNHGLNLGGEGGTTAVIAMRLNEGQRPFVDTFLGYNLLWFLPVAWLFQVTGPDYFVLRGFFFFLCACTAILGFLTVRRVLQSGLVALAVGICLVLIPGMIFRNYMGLLAVANQLALVAAFVLPQQKAAHRVVLVTASAAVLAFTFLVRIEVGWFMFVIWMGLLILSGFGPVRRSPCEVTVSCLVGLAMAALVHLPFVVDAHRRHYAPQFYGQYMSFLGLFRWEMEKQFVRPKREPQVGPNSTVTTASAGGAFIAPQEGRRLRPSASEMITARRSRDRYFAAAIHVPAWMAIALVGSAAVCGLVAWARRDSGLWRDALTVGVLTGCALTLFPQYYFFRPDTPHITEFMAPFLVAVACAAGIAVRRAVRAGGGPSAICAVGVCGALVVMVWVHFGHAWRKESAGTIAALKPGTVEFVGRNNVRVWLPPERAEGLSRLRDAILEHSAPGDWLVCLPYSPTINFLADRPSYLWDLYTDNTMAGPAFDAWRIAELGKYDPAVVVIDHRPINNSERSRLRNWAPRLYAHLHENYDFLGEFAENEVFIRRVGP
jgi:hypothetical protein